MRVLHGLRVRVSRGVAEAQGVRYFSRYQCVSRPTARPYALFLSCVVSPTCFRFPAAVFVLGSPGAPGDVLSQVSGCSPLLGQGCCGRKGCATHSTRAAFVGTPRTSQCCLLLFVVDPTYALSLRPSSCIDLQLSEELLLARLALLGGYVVTVSVDAKDVLRITR